MTPFVVPVLQWYMNKLLVLFGLFALLLLPAQGFCKVITSDTVWSGEVSVDNDILVPEGVTLTISPGTTVRMSASESTKTDPEFISPLNEIMVRGRLIANGIPASPVTFVSEDEKKSAWAGIIIDGGSVILHSSVVQGAESGIDIIKGSVTMIDSFLIKNRYGLVVQGPNSTTRIETTEVRDNDYGVLLVNGAEIQSKDLVLKDNRKKDRYSATAKKYPATVAGYTHKEKKAEISRIYRDEALLGLTIWQGRIEVNGVVRVPDNSRLVILPGTTVEFRRRDSNNDGIGENGLLIQGAIVAKGTKENPIVFRSAEKQRKMGDWDSINIMNSDKARNLIEHCRIEDGYRGLHFHYSNVEVAESVVQNNYRGIQFQESTVEISRTRFYENKSAVQARDSEIVFNDNVVDRNYSGMNLLRNSLTLKGNSIRNNFREGLRVREGTPLVERNLIDGNRYGMMVVDTVYGLFDHNAVSHNLESGITLKGTDNIELTGNIVQGNGLNGISIQDSSAVIRSNLISDNGERGIGVLSFQGVITGNNILNNGLYNLGIDGGTDVKVSMNWWGEGDLKKTIFDKDNDPSKGRAEYMPVLNAPVVITWPLENIVSDTHWHGDILIEKSVAVATGTDLVIAPKTRVFFSKGTGLVIKGKITAKGDKKGLIAFLPRKDADAVQWDEILLDHAIGSIFTHCSFENATWALHSHFTDLKVENCSFLRNSGGLRFTSGPIEVRRSLFSENEIGIRAFRGNALFTENIIANNRVGIFVREKGGGLTINRNNIFANSEFNIRIGDFNDEDVNAKDNWWGEGSPADSILDGRTDPGIGIVIFEPYSKQPFRIETIGKISDKNPQAAQPGRTKE